MASVAESTRSASCLRSMSAQTRPWLLAREPLARICIAFSRQAVTGDESAVTIAMRTSIAADRLMG